MTSQELSAFIAESRAICERATSGPWHVVEYASHHALQNTPEYAGIDVLDELGDGPNEPERNYDFCAHARFALPTALAELEVLSKIREAAEAWKTSRRFPDPDDGIIPSAVAHVLDEILAGRGPT